MNPQDNQAVTDFLNQLNNSVPPAVSPVPIVTSPASETEKLFARVRASGQPVVPSLSPLPQRQPQSPPGDNQGIFENFTNGVRRGALSTVALLDAAEGSVAGLLGFDQAQQDFFKDYDRLTKQAEQFRGSVGSVEEINSPLALIKFASGAIGENLPTLIATLLTGGVGGIATKLVAKRVITKVAGKELRDKLATAKIRGQIAGTVASSAVLGTGEVAGDLRSSGLDSAPATELAFGVTIGALDALPVVGLFKAFSLSRPFKNRVISEIGKRSLPGAIGRGAAIGAAAEVPTEVLQEALGIAAKSTVDDNFDALGPEARSRLLNAAAGALVVGGAIGGVGGGGLRQFQLRHPDVPIARIPPPEAPTVGLADTATELFPGVNETLASGEGIIPIDPPVLEDLTTSKKALAKVGIPTDEQNSETLGALGSGTENFSQRMKLMHGIVQLAKLNPSMRPFAGLLRAASNAASRTISRKDSIVGDLKALGEGPMKRVTDFMTERSIESSRLERPLDPEENRTLLNKFGIQMETEMNIISRMEQDLGQDIQRLHDLAIRDLRKQFNKPEDISVLAEREQEVNSELERLQQRNFFPLGRFGRHAVLVKARRSVMFEGQQFRKGETVSLENFENTFDQNGALAQARGEFNTQDFVVTPQLLDANMQSLQGIPPAFVRTLIEKLDLSETDRTKVKEAVSDASPAQAFRRKFRARKLVRGHSTDTLRAYIDNGLRVAHHSARLEFDPLLRAEVDRFNEDTLTISKAGGDPRIRQQITEAMNEHLDFMRKPGNELAAVRTFTYHFYLGASVRSAFTNLTQVPFFTFPKLWAVANKRAGHKNLDPRGMVTAQRHLVRAYKESVQYWRDPEKLSPEQLQMIGELKDRGSLDQSLSAHIVDLSEGGNLQRLLPASAGGRLIKNASHYSSWMFQGAEHWNRRVSAIAAYNMAREQGLNHQQAVGGLFSEGSADEVVNSTQFNFEKFNRPALVRGKKAALFIFWQHRLNMLFFARHDIGAQQWWLVQGLMAGALGLPFADDIADFVDFAATKMKGQLGFKNPKVDVRLLAREYLTSIGASPDLILHGLGRNYMTPGLAIDLSGTFTYGNLIPGFGPALDLASGQGDFNSSLGRVAKEAGGAGFSVAASILQAATSPDLSTVKRLQLALPSALRNLVRAGERVADGEATTLTGKPIPNTEFDPAKPLDYIQITMEAMGFQNSEVAKEGEARRAVNEVAAFYGGRKNLLLRQWRHVIENGRNPKAMADMRKHIKRFNTSLAGRYRAFVITGDTLRKVTKNASRSAIASRRRIELTKTRAAVAAEVLPKFPNLTRVP